MSDKKRRLYHAITFYTLCCYIILQSIECKQNHLFERKIKDEKIHKAFSGSFCCYNHKCIEDTINDIIDVNISDINILKGTVDNDLLTESIRIKGDVVVGGRYLMLFTKMKMAI